MVEIDQQGRVNIGAPFWGRHERFIGCAHGTRHRRVSGFRRAHAASGGGSDVPLDDFAHAIDLVLADVMIAREIDCALVERIAHLVVRPRFEHR